MRQNTKTQNMTWHFILFLCLLISINACKPSQDNKTKTSKRSFKDDVNVVITAKANRQNFYKEFFNNGVLSSYQKAQLGFNETGKIIRIKASNGQFVKQGDTIAVLEDFTQQFNYEKACRNVEKCRLSFEESLIDQGYTLSDSASVPANVLNIALIRSGYQDALGNKKLAAYRLKNTHVIAPFSGIIADLEAKPNNLSSSYKTCCTLIDNQAFEVEFPMLESEVSQLEVGMQVHIVPFAFTQDTLIGKLSVINPKVEENGMVDVKAIVKNKSGKLLDGMNVKVMVKKDLGTKICIPKDAVTLRQERNVVFVAHNDTAYWRYVDVGETNSSFSVIKGGIYEGEQVVVEGNFNLAHLSPIKVIKEL